MEPWEIDIEYFDLNMVRKFIYAIPEWVETLSKSPTMPAFAMQTMFLIDYYTCIRPYAELKRIRKPDFDMEHQILRAANHKGNFFKTTIPRPLMPILEKYLQGFNDKEVLFEGSRKTFHNWVKWIGAYAKISYWEEFKKKSIDGPYLYLFKHAYTQRLQAMGCPGAYISIKDRHTGSARGMASTTVNYARSMRGLIGWENNHMTETWEIKKDKIVESLEGTMIEK